VLPIGVSPVIATQIGHMRFRNSPQVPQQSEPSPPRMVNKLPRQFTVVSQRFARKRPPAWQQPPKRFPQLNQQLPRQLPHQGSLWIAPPQLWHNSAEHLKIPVHIEATAPLHAWQTPAVKWPMVAQQEPKKPPQAIQAPAIALPPPAANIRKGAFPCWPPAAEPLLTPPRRPC